MTKVDLQQVLGLDAHATVGPWEHVVTNYPPHQSYVLAEGIGGIADGTKPADAGLIAFYRTAAPAMARALHAVMEIAERAESKGAYEPNFDEAVRVIHYYLGDHDE